MNNRMRRSLVAVGALGAVAFPLAGMAAAEEGDGHGYPSTQSPTQAVDAVGAIGGTAGYGVLDAADSYSPGNRPEGVAGTEVEFPALTPGYAEGPVGGLLNGPFE
ncbi:hypothetical protein SAMN05216207_1014163 [Pseudonocardia ammonioxydans]|uniref:Uncharacterized protein n=2 Tax=Pseudonocardia ammonioxydans TaxID=260086 RepID=A0A1I4Z891_PSUAM|nr:hypothetical protein [Pseudonocardia ammonioxydans]SFN46514.1 hypothetical protein SAMN05216207_1014163 [Pseudonocardia ammonioxydans]